MKAKKIVRYRLSISRVFPATHKRKGEHTFFIEIINRFIANEIYFKDSLLKAAGINRSELPANRVERYFNYQISNNLDKSTKV